MKTRTMLLCSIGLVLALSPSVFGDISQRISVRVVDELGQPVEGATVTARYLETIRQNGKDYPVPMDLAPSQTTDMTGRCELALRDVSSSLLGLKAHRVELTTEEAMKLCDNAPRDPVRRKAFDRELDDRCQRFASAYQILDPRTDRGTLVTLKLSKAIKVTGRVHVNGAPLPKAFVTIHSRKTKVDQLFARFAPEVTDHEGKFSYYSVPAELDRARIVAERVNGNRVLTVAGIEAARTKNGLFFQFDNEAKDYSLEGRPLQR